MTTLTRPHRDARWLCTSAPEFISASSVAEVMGLHRETVGRMIEDGTIPATRTRKNVLIARQVLLDLLHLEREDPEPEQVDTGREIPRTDSGFPSPPNTRESTP